MACLIPLARHKTSQKKGADRIMQRRLLWLTVFVVGMSILISCAGAPPHMRPGAIIPEGELVGRLVTAKIDLPMRAGMVVYANGEIDFTVYRNKLEALGPSIRRYERAQITEIEREGDGIQVRLNNGGKGGLIHKGHLKWLQPHQFNSSGTTIHIKYGRSSAESDFTPERVAYALRDVLEIEGVGAAATPAITPTDPVSAAVSEGVKLLSVEAQPSRVMRGQPLDLTVHFEVEGASNENPLGLTIHRQVYQGEKPLFSSPRTQAGHWASGVHSAHFTLTVPSTTVPGVYRFKAWISHGGKEESREALFEVLESGGR